MKKVEIHSEFVEYGNVDELPDDDQRLVVEARLSVNKAYAPYSRFQVGAAVLLENGIVMRGNNQENASYPIGLCAERVAIFAAGANYPGVQAIAEYEHRYHGPIRMIMVGETGKVLVADSISQFLPYQFTADDLNLKRT